MYKKFKAAKGARRGHSVCGKLEDETLITYKALIKALPFKFK